MLHLRSNTDIRSVILFSFLHSHLLSIMTDSSQLILQAIYAFVQGDKKKSLNIYLKAIRNILKNESLTQVMPRPYDVKELPKETLAIAFEEVSSFMRGGTFTQGKNIINQRSLHQV